MFSSSSAVLSSRKDLKLPLSSLFEYKGYWELSQEEDPKEDEGRTTLLVNLLIISLRMFATRKQRIRGKR